ncbi:unnamed protein product, partial [Didymodactylos carnosus]
EGNINNLNIINKWNGISELQYWGTKYCNQINGTDGTWFPPLSSSDHSRRLYMYSSDICRSVYATYESKSTVRGISTDVYSIPAEVFQNGTLNPDNAGYGNLDSGILNVSQCKENAPIIMSLPHFLYAADQYQERIDGLEPNADAHRTVLNVEPHTGLILQANKRLQINIFLQHNPYFQDLSHLDDIIIPTIWINESTTIDEQTAKDLKSKLLRYYPIVHYTGLGLTILGCIGLFLLIIIIFRLYHPKFKNEKQLIQVNINETQQTETTPLLFNT